MREDDAMRTEYADALRTLLEDVIDGEGRDRVRPEGGRSTMPRRSWRTVVVTGVVAVAVVVLGVLAAIHPLGRDSSAPAGSSAPSTTGPSARSLIYLGLVPWNAPSVASNPASRVRVNPNLYALHSGADMCGVSVLRPTVTVTGTTGVTVAIRGYGYRIPPGTACTLPRVYLVDYEVPLGRQIMVTSATDAATHHTYVVAAPTVQTLGRGAFVIVTHPDSQASGDALLQGLLGRNAKGCITIGKSVVILPAGSTLSSNGTVTIPSTATANGKTHIVHQGDTASLGGGAAARLPAHVLATCGADAHYFWAG